MRSLGVVAFLVSLPVVPAVFSPPFGPYPELRELAEFSVKHDGGNPEKDTEAVERQYQAFVDGRWAEWRQNVAFVGVSLVASLLAYFRKRLGAWLIAAASGYVLLISAPPLVRMSADGGFFNLASLIVSVVVPNRGLLNGVLLFWHMIVAPFVYALLAVVAAIHALAPEPRRPDA